MRPWWLYAIDARCVRCRRKTGVWIQIRNETHSFWSVGDPLTCITSRIGRSSELAQDLMEAPYESIPFQRIHQHRQSWICLHHPTDNASSSHALIADRPYRMDWYQVACRSSQKRFSPPGSHVHFLRPSCRLWHLSPATRSDCYFRWPKMTEWTWSYSHGGALETVANHQSWVW